MAGSLSEALQGADMLLIDGLHAFDFSAGEKGLMIECMDGRELKRWHFVPEQVEQAQFEPALGHWLVSTAAGTHQLACLDATCAGEEEDDPG